MDNRVRGPLPVSRNVTLIQESLSQKGIVTLAVLEHYYLDPLNQGWTKFYNPHSNTFYRESTVARQVDKILEYIDAYQDKPFFLFAHLNEPHHNYLLHKGFDRWGTNTWGRYRSELAFTDHHLKRVFDKIDRISNRRPTLILLSADHGEGLGEHGIRFHNGGFYRELVWVPLIIHHPTLKPRQLEQPVSLLDIAPTLRNLYGLEPASRHVGTSLLGQIVNGDEYGERTIYHQGLYDQGGRYYNLVGISTKRYRLLHDMRNQTFEFFDLQNDPLEKNNLSDENGIPFQAMKKELLDWLEAIELKSSFVHRDWETAPPGAKRRRR
jgi:arylsulfatase A-like enzyme